MKCNKLKAPDAPVQGDRDDKRTSKHRKGCDERDGERGGSDKVDDTADAREEVATVFHAEAAFNERTGEISHNGNQK